VEADDVLDECARPTSFRARWRCGRVVDLLRGSQEAVARSAIAFDHGIHCEIMP
jgi:hypothetical protein